MRAHAVQLHVHGAAHALRRELEADLAVEFRLPRTDGVCAAKRRGCSRRFAEQAARLFLGKSPEAAMQSLNLEAGLGAASSTGLYALEVTGKDIAQVEASKAEIPLATPTNIAFLGNEDHAQRVNAARVIRRCGFEPVPIISSRRLRSEQDRDSLLSALIGEANPTRFILVGGDPATPAGPYADSLALLKSGIVRRYGMRHVGIVAYPEGHPKIDAAELWRALKWKHAFLEDAGCTVEITTQFGFDADAIVRWIERLRAEEIDSPVRIGIPGPADVGKLLRYARQFGVVASAGIARRYGLSLTNLLQRIAPDRFFERLASGLDRRNLGPVLYHLYPFGGIAEGVRWMKSRRPALDLLAVRRSSGE
jgi:methylenetetrahydrofolate reductase (NADPH)